MSVIAVCGAPGSGKTTVLPHLADLLRPRVVVDLDEILEPGGTLLGLPIASEAGRPHWPAYDALWERIIATITRAGHDTVVLCPVPAAGALTNSTNPVDRWLLLDCPDGERRRRLAVRSWEADRIDDALADAAVGRELIRESVASFPFDPRVTARTIAERLGPPDHRW